MKQSSISQYFGVNTSKNKSEISSRSNHQKNVITKESFEKSIGKNHLKSNSNKCPSKKVNGKSKVVNCETNALINKQNEKNTETSNKQYFGVNTSKNKSERSSSSNQQNNVTTEESIQKSQSPVNLVEENEEVKCPPKEVKEISKLVNCETNALINKQNLENTETSNKQFFGTNSLKKKPDVPGISNNQQKNVNTKENLQKSKSPVKSLEDNDEVIVIKNSKKRKRLLDSDSDSNKSSESPRKKGKMEIEKHTNESEIKDEEKSEISVKQPTDYNPMAEKYHVINDACWKPSEKVPYLALAKTFESIESNSKRLEKTRALSNFMRSVIYLSPNDFVACMYLILNKVAPDYESVELGVGEFVVKNALTQATDVDKKTIDARMKTEGDLGLIAFNLPSSQTFLVRPAKLTVPAVFQKLKTISTTIGKSSNVGKSDIIKNLLIASSKVERKYIVRSLLGELRIGVAEKTILNALGQAVTMTPPNEKRLNVHTKELDAAIDINTKLIKTAFCQCPSYDILINSIFKYDLSNLLDHCAISPGIPVRPMLAFPSKGVSDVLQKFDDLDFTCEYKYDGERAQIHVSTDVNGKQKVQIFSRNMENNTTKYPDIINLIKEMLPDGTVQSCIIDSEAVAWDRETKSILPFQKLSTRKKKDVNEDEIKIQVCIYAFDLIYFNGQSLVKQSLKERRDILRENFIEKPGQFMLASSINSCTTDEISEFLEQSIKDKCEGLMIKTFDKNATYQISQRSRKWWKLKKDYLDKLGDTVDLVVIGASFGTGKRANKYGTFLLGCYDPENDMYQTICKLGTGFSDEDLDNFYNQLKEIVTRRPDNYYDYDKTCKPDCWFDPKYVWEIKAADLSISPDHKAAVGLVDDEKGISLRFPRFIRIREDKKPESATTSRQIAEMYRNQDSVKNTQLSFEDDEFY